MTRCPVVLTTGVSGRLANGHDKDSAGVELTWAAEPESPLYLIVARAIFTGLRLPGAAKVGAGDLRSWTLVSRCNGDGGTTG